VSAAAAEARRVKREGDGDGNGVSKTDVKNSFMGGGFLWRRGRVVTIVA